MVKILRSWAVVIAVLVWLLAVGTAQPVFAAELTVPSVSYPTIQSAIDAATAGDTIRVAAGTYSENITISGKNIQLIGAGWESTIIHGDETDSVIKAINLNQTSLVEGFTIENGKSTNGGGMNNQAASPRVVNCRFTGNRANNQNGCGGAMYNNSATRPEVTGCIFDNNSAYRGGAIYNNQKTVTDFKNCVIYGNTASNFGGGMFNTKNKMDMINCVIAGNTGFSGGAIYNGLEVRCNLTNCTITGNTGTDRTGGIHNAESCELEIANCILWGQISPELMVDVKEIYKGSKSKITVYHTDIEGGWIDGSEIIDQDPLLADPANHDVHLTSGSPCIDSGYGTVLPPDISTDFEGDARFLDGDDDGTVVVDIGADEYQFVAPSPVSVGGQVEPTERFLWWWPGLVIVLTAVAGGMIGWRRIRAVRR